MEVVTWTTSFFSGTLPCVMLRPLVLDDSFCGSALHVNGGRHLDDQFFSGAPPCVMLRPHVLDDSSCGSALLVMVFR